MMRVYTDFSRGEKKILFESFKELIGFNEEFLEESLDDPYFYDLLEKKQGLDFREARCPLSLFMGRVLYAILRTKKPELVVETGVAHGVSTSFILSALNKNKKGNLISVDISHDVGCLVSEELKDRWELMVGTSRKILPKLKIRDIDIFLHDSLHSYRNMMFEYDWAYPRLSGDGLLLTHDLDTTDAFFIFGNKIRRRVYFLPTSKTEKNSHRVGAICKNDYDYKRGKSLVEVLT